MTKWNIHYVRTTGSTNDDAFRAGTAGAPAGLVITAEEQTAGRGRLNRSWHSPRGAGLYVSALVRPGIPAERAGLLSFCSANAMRSAAEECGLKGAVVKWPNDLIAGGKKICGILSACRILEERLDFAVIGTGLNLKCGSYPEELSDRAGCLEEMGILPDRETLLHRYLEQLEFQIRALEETPIRVLEETRAHCITLGREVLVSGETELRGTAREIGPAG